MHDSRCVLYVSDQLENHPSIHPDSKIHGANVGPPGVAMTQVGPIMDTRNLAIWVQLLNSIHT